MFSEEDVEHFIADNSVSWKFSSCVLYVCLSMYCCLQMSYSVLYSLIYSETSDIGHSERGQTSQQKDKLKILLCIHSIENHL